MWKKHSTLKFDVINHFTSLVSQLVDDEACSHIRMPKVMIDMISLAKQPQSACRYNAFPCANKEEWLSGNCFDTTAANDTIAGYETDLKNKKTGVFFLSTLADNITTGGFCGTIYKAFKDLKVP